MSSSQFTKCKLKDFLSNGGSRTIAKCVIVVHQAKFSHKHKIVDDLKILLCIKACTE